MTRLALLEIGDGDFNTGFNVSLQILKSSSFPSRKIAGNLPPNPDIEGFYISWQTNFRSLKGFYANSQDCYQRGNYDDWQIDESVVTNRSTSEGVAACRQFVNILEISIQQWVDLSPNLNKNLGAIRERLAIEFNNKSDPIQFIISSKNPFIWKLHWYVWDLLENNLDIGISFILPQSDKQEAQPVSVIQKNHVRILAVFGDDNNINLQPDWEEIDKLQNQGAEVVPLRKPTAQQLIETLGDKQGWHILFFAGHSDTQNNIERIYINDKESLEIEQFKNALKEAREQGLKIAIFNSCKGLGLAIKLAALEIPVIIVMQDVVPDIVAQFFLKEFLREYAGGEALHTAVRRAQARLEKFTDLPGATWLPVMFQSHLEVPPTWEDFLIKAKVDYVESNRKFKFPYDQYKFIALSPPYNRRKPKFRVLLLVSLTITLLLMGVRSLGILEPLELWGYDHFMQLELAPQKLDDKIIIIGVNDNDVQNFEKDLEDHLTDRTINQLLTKLEKYQPRVIGLDIERPDPTWNKADWESLGKHIQNSTRPIIAVCVVGETQQEQPLFTKKFPPGISPERISFSDGLMSDFDHPTHKTVRRYSLVMDLRPNSSCPTQYSFSFQVMKHYLPPHTQYSYNPSKNLLINNNVIKILHPDVGGYKRLKDEMNGYQILINYRPHYRIRQPVSLTEIMNAQDSELSELIYDRVILIGYLLSDRHVDNDSFFTPIGKLHGVKIHAQVISQLIDTIENQRPLLSCFPKTVELFWIYCCSIFGGIFVIKFPSISRLTIAILIAIFALFLICFISFIQGFWIPILISCLSLIFNSYTFYFYCYYYTGGKNI